MCSMYSKSSYWSLLSRDAFVTFIWIRQRCFFAILPDLTAMFSLFDIPFVTLELLGRIIYVRYDIINGFAVNVPGLTILLAKTLYSVTAASHDKSDIT